MHFRCRRIVALALCGGAAALPGCFNPSASATSETETTSGGETESTSATASSASTSAPTTSTSGDESTTTTSTTNDTLPTTGGTDTTGGSTVGASTSDTASGTTMVCDSTGGVELEPPELLAVEFTGLNEVTLTFSEPMDNPEDVLPGQFRLSAAESIYAPGPNPTYYRDLGFLDAETIAVDGIEFHPCTAPEEMILSLDGDLTQALCDEVASWINPGSTDGAIFLHYSQGVDGGNPVQDAAGNDLADISGDWVLAAPNAELMIGTYAGHFPYMIPDLPIACP